MIFSNIRLEKKDNYSYLKVDVHTNYTSKNVLWISVPSQYESWLTSDVYDAFLIAGIYPAMFYHEDIEIKGNVSHKLYFNCLHSIQYSLECYRDYLKQVNIKVDGFASAEVRHNVVGLGFTAGVDAFSTFINRFELEKDEDYKINTLFLFNVGSHSYDMQRAEMIFGERYNLLKQFADEKGLPIVPVNTNLFDFYLPMWEYDAGVLCKAVAILSLQSAIRKYFISGDYSFKISMLHPLDREHEDFSGVAEKFIYHLLSTDVTDIILEGGNLTRMKKTEMLTNYEPAYRYLNVCVAQNQSRDDVSNCSKCHKCIRTMVALDTLGALNRFAGVFDVDDYLKHSFKYKCMIRLSAKSDPYSFDNIEYANNHNYKIPSFFISWIYINLLKIPKIPKKIRSFFK